MHHLQISEREQDITLELSVSIWICGTIWLDICQRTYINWYSM